MDDKERRVVYRQSEVEEFYYYKDGSEAPRPQFFPCIMYQEWRGGGLGGEYVAHGFEYSPPGVDFASWAAGKGAISIEPRESPYVKATPPISSRKIKDPAIGMTVALPDCAKDEGYAAQTQVSVRPSGNGIEIDIEGCGLKTMESGKGQVIYLEMFRGSPRLLVWSDISSEDPTHVIDLADALEIRRGDIDD